jgi:HK97 family phage major capsid protein
MNLDVKAVGTMSITNNYSGGTVALSQLEAGVTRIARRMPFLRQLVNASGTTSKYITYIQSSGQEGGADMTAEGALKSQADFNVVETSVAVKKVTAWIKVSKEMIADLPFMRNEIDNELMEIVELKLDSQILSGDGAGDNLVGILQNAVAWAAGNFALAYVSPNEFDVLAVAIAQIQTGLFNANYIVLHPEDAVKMQLNKTTTGEYTYAMQYVDANGVTRVKGIPVVENTGMTAGTFLVGDFTKSNLRIREDLNIQVGYVNDDFTKNLMTILCEARAVHYVKSNHYNAFVKGTFSTAKTALLKP